MDPPKVTPAASVMNMKFAPIVNPEVRRASPQPVRVDLRTVFLVGIGAWVVAAIVCAVLLAVGLHAMPYLQICLAGIVVGIALLIWEHFDRCNYRKLGA